MNDIFNKISSALIENRFFETHSDLTDPESIISEINKLVPEATPEDIDQYLTMGSALVRSSKGELDETDLENVSGGFGITITIATATFALKALTAVAAASAGVGAAVWYWKNRKG